MERTHSHHFFRILNDLLKCWMFSVIYGTHSLGTTTNIWQNTKQKKLNKTENKAQIFYKSCSDFTDLGIWAIDSIFLQKSAVKAPRFQSKHYIDEVAVCRQSKASSYYPIDQCCCLHILKLQYKENQSVALNFANFLLSKSNYSLHHLFHGGLGDKQKRIYLNRNKTKWKENIFYVHIFWHNDETHTHTQNNKNDENFGQQLRNIYIYNYHTKQKHKHTHTNTRIKVRK